MSLKDELKEEIDKLEKEYEIIRIALSNGVVLKGNVEEIKDNSMILDDGVIIPFSGISYIFAQEKDKIETERKYEHRGARGGH